MGVCNTPLLYITQKSRFLYKIVNKLCVLLITFFLNRTVKWQTDSSLHYVSLGMTAHVCGKRVKEERQSRSSFTPSSLETARHPEPSARNLLAIDRSVFSTDILCLRHEISIDYKSVLARGSLLAIA